MHIPFDTRTVRYDEHFYGQMGGGIADGGPLSEPYTYFRGMPYQRGFGVAQRGAGIGDVLRHLWRMVLPVVRRAGTAVGREALNTGGRILERVAQGDNLKEAAISEGRQGVNTLIQKGRSQFGGGRRKAIKRGRVHRPSHQMLIGRSVIKPPPKRHRSDTFGLY